VPPLEKNRYLLMLGKRIRNKFDTIKPMDAMVITLIGYRGTGKSTVGEQLAGRLNWNVVDSDREIEMRAGKSIAEIFTEDSEDVFRSLEREVLAELLGQNEIVIAAGGGAILDETTCQQMQTAGPVVWLTAEVETIVKRLSHDPATPANRPALAGADAVSEVQDVLANRLQRYQTTASMTVSTDDRTVPAIVDEIVSSLPLNEGTNW